MKTSLIVAFDSRRISLNYKRPAPRMRTCMRNDGESKCPLFWVLLCVVVVEVASGLIYVVGIEG